MRIHNRVHPAIQVGRSASWNQGQLLTFWNFAIECSYYGLYQFAIIAVWTGNADADAP